MPIALDAAALGPVKESYFNILAWFLGKEEIKSSHVRCLLRWGLQLYVDQQDVSEAVLNRLTFKQPKGKVEKLESIYHLAYLINQDEVIEDVELEVASMYAREMGFAASVVSDLFKSVATANDDGITPSQWRQEVVDFLRVHNL